MAESIENAAAGGFSVVVKNTFLEVKEDSDSDAPAPGRPRSETLPHDFGSKLLVADVNDEGSTESEVDTASATSSFSQRSASLSGRVWALSQDSQGCRDIQDMLGDEACAMEYREALAQELRGHILAAVVCPYANFVLQKCVVVLRSEAIQFIVEEIPAAEVSAVAQNKFGCRVLLRLLERCDSSQVRPLVEAVLDDFIGIAQSPYGNYVVQNLLECGGADAGQRLRLAQLLEAAAGVMGTHPFGCIVVSAGLSKSSAESRLAIAHAILNGPGLLVNMALTRHGHRAVLVLLGVLEGSDLAMARHLLTTDEGLPANKFGRVVLASLRQA